MPATGLVLEECPEIGLGKVVHPAAPDFFHKALDLGGYVVHLLGLCTVLRIIRHGNHGLVANCGLKWTGRVVKALQLQKVGLFVEKLICSRRSPEDLP